MLLDVYRGMPAIYAAYTGYDEIAHHFGAASKEAFRAVRAVDKQIRQIDRMRQLYHQREYDLYILSDHGMSPSVPFKELYGLALQDLIATHTGEEVRLAEAEEKNEGLPEARIRFLLDEIRGLEESRQRPVAAQLLRATRRRIETSQLVEALEAEWDLDRRADITVRNSGSLSHVYFDVTPRPMDLSEVALLYPALLQELVGHEGIGLVVGRDGQEVVIAARQGTLWIGPDGQRLEGQDPLGYLSDPEWAAGQVARVARFPHAGDLILLGAWNGEFVVSFEEQVASHGGLGGPQDWPFIAFSPDQLRSPLRIRNSEEIYSRLVSHYGDYG